MIVSLQNPLVKHLVKLRENKKYRHEQGTVLITGFTLVQEIAQITPPLKVFTTYPTEYFAGAKIFTVSEEVIKKITGLAAPEPIAAEFKIPNLSFPNQIGSLLVLDAIRDPGNLGALIRSALAFDWEGIFFLPTCADPFHEKTLRASRGALFRLPCKTGSWEELSLLQQQQQLNAYIADLEGTPLPDLKGDKKKPLLILSNEAQGVSQEGKDFGQKISIPMSPAMESLNVAAAGAILMYVLKHE